MELLRDLLGLSVGARRVRPVRVALQNQRDTLLAFAGVLDAKLADIAQAHDLAEPLVREACVLHRLPSTSAAYWQRWNRLRAQTGGKFHTLFDAVSRAMAQTPRSSALVENLNSRLRTYFTLCRHLDGSGLDLLLFFLTRIIHRTARNRPRPPNTWARDFIAKNFIKPPIRIVVSDINGLALIAHFS